MYYLKNEINIFFVGFFIIFFGIKNVKFIKIESCLLASISYEYTQIIFITKYYLKVELELVSFFWRFTTLTSGVYFSKIFVNSSIGGQLSAPPNTTITFETVRNANNRCGMLDICRNTESNSEDHTLRREETWKAREGTPTVLYSDELCPTILFGLTFVLIETY